MLILFDGAELRHDREREGGLYVYSLEVYGNRMA